MKSSKTDQMGLRKTRRKPIFLWLLALLILTSLACGLSVQFPFTRPTATPSATATHTPLPPTNTATATPTATPVPPTSTPSPTPTPTLTPRPTASPAQLRVLDELWNIIDQNYIYEDFNGLDWEAVYQEYRRKVEAGVSNEEFYQAMSEMVASLGDEHSTYFSPDEAKEDDEEYTGAYNYVGIGVIANAVPERDRVTIVLVFPDSPADQAGLKPHDSILEVDGEPILEGEIDRRVNLRGPAGSQVTLKVQSPGQAPRQIQLTRRQIDSEIPVPYEILTSPDGRRIGYILLTTLYDQTVPRKVRQAILDMSADRRLEGLILDNRQNGGGASNIFSDILSFFEDGKVGQYVNREGQEPIVVAGRNIQGSQQIPLVVLVGENTASYGEIISGILKDTQRAHLIGETTSGNVEILYVYDFSDGSRAWIAHDRFEALNHPDQNWEETGIIPHLTVISNWDEVTLQNDPVIAAALEHFDR